MSGLFGPDAVFLDYESIQLGRGGGVGVPLLQLARMLGIRVVGTASPAKHEFLTSLGAVPVAYGDGVADRIRAAATKGVDGVFDLVGADALRAVATMVRPDRLFSVADKPLVGMLGGRDVARDRSSRVLAELARLVADGDLDPHATYVRPLSEAEAALALVEQGHTQGKIVLVP